MRLVLLALLLLAPTMAWANDAIRAVAMIVASYVGGPLGFAIAAAATIGSVVYGNAKKRREERRMKKEYNDSLSDKLITASMEDMPWRYVYGRTRVGSQVVALLKGGDKDQYNYMVCVHASHEIDAYEEIWVNGKLLGPLVNGEAVNSEYTKTTTEYEVQAPVGGATSLVLTHVPIDGSIVVSQYFGADNGGSQSLGYTYDPATRTISWVPLPWAGTSAFEGQVSVSYNWNKVESRVKVSLHLGTASDPADAMLLAEVPTQWKATSVLRGHAYSVVRLDLNEPAFQSGMAAVEVVIRGKKVYDFRTGVTAWSRNPAICAYDYLLSEMCGVESDELPLDQWIAGANVCDETITGSAAGPQPRYVFDGVVTADDDQRKALEDMAQSMAGGIVDTTWDIYAGTYTAPVMDLVQTDIIGKVQINAGASDSAVYNGVKGRFSGVTNNYVATDFKPYQNASFVATDGEEIWTSIDFPYTSDEWHIHNLCRIAVEDQRNGLNADIEFSLKAWPLKVGQRIRLTAPLFGWSNKIFRVIDKKFGPGMPVKLSIKEDTASIWDLADAVVVDATPNTTLPNPFNLNPVASVTCSSGTEDLLLQGDGTVVSRIRVTWPQLTQQAVYGSGKVQIGWINVNGDSLNWESMEVRGSETQAFISPVSDGAYYGVRVRAYDPYLNVYSNWTYARTHKVIGKSDPPPNYDTFKVSFQPDGTRQFEYAYTTTTPPADLAGALIRYKQGSDPTPAWDSMTPLNSPEPPYPASPYETNLLLSGPHTFALKAIDRTKNVSSSTLYIQATLPDRRLGNVLEEYYEHTGGWLGTKTGCFVTSEGILEAVNLDTWATIPTTWSAWTRWNSNPTNPINYETPVRDLGSVVTGVLNSSMIASGSAVVTLRTSNDGVSWSAYGPADVQFTARFVQAKVTVTATGPEPIPMVTSWVVQVQAEVIEEILNDVVISTLTGANRIGVGDVRAPIQNTYAVIREATAVIQDSSAASWTYTLQDKSPSGPRYQFRSNGVLADPAKVDFFIKGS